MDRRALFGRLAKDFRGLERRDPVVDLQGGAREARRVYMDTTATALMPGLVMQGLEAYFEDACANSHTEAHRAGRDTTAAIEDSRRAVGELVGCNPNRDVVLFTANGATGAINFLARALFPPELRPLIKRFPKGAPAGFKQTLADALPRALVPTLDELEARPLVVMTVMEHHSNLLPWIEAVGHHNVRAIGVRADGTLDMDELERVLEDEGPRVRMVAVTGVSNVTGIVNPVHEIAAMAHGVGAQIMVDAAQWVPHAPVRLHRTDPAENIDFLVLSGHKLYAPGSRGALIGDLSTLECRRCVSDVGGGMVEYVAIDDFELKKDVTAREEAGTPNIPGTIAMGLVARVLTRIGMDVVAEEEEKLSAKLVERLLRVDAVKIYGSTDLGAVHRAGVVSFNVAGLDHSLVAAYLNDFHNIAVRNGCFCAHPYVKALMQFDSTAERSIREEMARGDRRNVPGMVRASLGIYSTEDDVEALGEALEQLVRDRDHVAGRYQQELDGSYRFADGRALPCTFRVEEQVGRWESGGR